MLIALLWESMDWLRERGKGINKMTLCLVVQAQVKWKMENVIVLLL